MGHMPIGVNETVIFLIPNIPDLVWLTNFRRISLCNAIYKIVAKCLVNKLRPLLVEIMSPYQSAFVPGRLITDNALSHLNAFTLFNMRRIQRIAFALISLIFQRLVTGRTGGSWSRRWKLGFAR